MGMSTTGMSSAWESTEHLSACRGERVDVTGPTTTETTTGQFEAVNVALAMELGATGLAGAPAGGGEDEGGNVIHGEIAVKTKHPQDPKLPGNGVLGGHRAAEVIPRIRRSEGVTDPGITFGDAYPPKLGFHVVRVRSGPSGDGLRWAEIREATVFGAKRMELRKGWRRRWRIRLSVYNPTAGWHRLARRHLPSPPSSRPRPIADRGKLTVRSLGCSI